MRTIGKMWVRGAVVAGLIAATSIAIGNTPIAFAGVVDLAVTLSTPTPLTAGGQTTMTMTVTNTGTATVTGATATGATVQFLSQPVLVGPASFVWTCAASGGATCVGGSSVAPASTALQPIHTLVTLPPGGQAVYSVIVNGIKQDDPPDPPVTFSASVATSAGDVDAHHANDLASVTVTGNDLSITISDGTNLIPTSGSTTYLIKVTNSGTTVALGVPITNTLPPGVVAGSVTWTCPVVLSCGAPSGTGAINTTVSLNPGETVTFTQIVPVPSPLSPLAYENEVAVVPPSPPAFVDTNEPDNTDSDIDLPPIGPTQADVTVSLTDGRTDVWAGFIDTYTLVVTNHGPGTATATTAATFPAAASWTCAATAGSSCAGGSVAAAALMQDPIVLLNNGTVTYTVTVTVPSPLPPSWQAITQVTGAPGALGGNPFDDLASDVGIIQPTVDLSIEIDDGVTNVLPGDAVTYTIRVRNNSASDGAFANVDDVIPSSLTGANWTCLGAGASQCRPAGAGDVHDIVALAPSGTVTYTVHATVAAGATGQVSNTATVTPPADSPGAVPPFPATPGLHDPNPSNNSATDTDAVPAADLAPTLDFVSLVPERLLDTRGPDPIGYVGTKPAAGAVVRVHVTGVGASAVPLDAKAVVFNLTGSEADSDGFVTAWPCGAAQPNASNLNVTAHANIPNLIISKVGEGGDVCLFTQPSQHLIVDIAGYMPGSSRYVPVTPERLLDSRSPGQIGYVGDKPGTGAIVRLHVTGVGSTNVPGDAAAVVLNVTGTEAGADGYVTVWPCGAAQPTASNLNLAAGASRPNLVIAKIGEGGDVCLFTQSPSHLLADVLGYMPTGTSYAPVVPVRLLDTRGGSQVGYTGDKPAAGAIVRLHVTGDIVPASASAVVLNVTGTAAAADGYVTVWPCGAAQPSASNLNLRSGETAPNLVIAKIGADGDVCLYTQSSVDLIADVNGYWAG